MSKNREKNKRSPKADHKDKKEKTQIQMDEIKEKKETSIKDDKEKKEIKSLKLYGKLTRQLEAKNIIPILDVRITDTVVEYLMPLSEDEQ